MEWRTKPVEEASEFALKDLGRTFHELMGVFVSMNLVVDHVQQCNGFSNDVKGLAQQASERMHRLIPRLQSFYTRYQ